MLDQFSKMQKEAKKDGKNYITSCHANKGISDPRSQGFNLIAHTSFESLEDMKYYDEEDPVHKELRSFGNGKVNPPPIVVYMEHA